jgi:hypothetical protein
VSGEAEVVRLERIRPVKWSAIDRKVEPFRLGYVKTFLQHEGRPLLDEDGSPVLTAQGHHMEVTANSFARHMGIPPGTFKAWVTDLRGITAPWNQRFSERTISDRSEHHGQCSHCPDFDEEGGDKP